jgi:PhnB protein
MKASTGPASIEPWLTVGDGEAAVRFYKSAFGAKETYRLGDSPDDLIVRLAVGDAGFWVSCSNKAVNSLLGGDNVRMILIMDDPDSFYATAVKSGATPVWPVGEEHGWRLGRLVDPFGLHWEVGHMLK